MLLERAVDVGQQLLLRVVADSARLRLEIDAMRRLSNTAAKIVDADHVPEASTIQPAGTGPVDSGSAISALPVPDHVWTGHTAAKGLPGAALADPDRPSARLAPRIRSTCRPQPCNRAHHAQVMTISSPRAARSTDLDKRFLASRLSTVVMVKSPAMARARLAARSERPRFHVALGVSERPWVWSARGLGARPRCSGIRCESITCLIVSWQGPICQPFLSIVIRLLIMYR